LKVIFAIPPIPSNKGQAQTSQNRQWQVFRDPTLIYPVLPATFISMLLTEPKQQVLWVDAIAEEMDEVEFAKVILDMNPDYMVFEANTMVIKRYYEIIDGLKKNLPKIKIILAGEHYTVMPEEVKANCKADHLLHGGRWFYEAFKIITGKKWPKDKPLPKINRDVTRWWLYAEANGNFKYTPATYTMASMDCWYRPKQPCTFCTWVNYFPETTTRTVDDFYDEVFDLANMGFREFFDDSGTFPVGKWLKEFCDRMSNEIIDYGGQKIPLSKIIKWGCNMRFKALQPEDFKMMADAGCRFILWGFESANQLTLDKLSKGYDVGCVSKNLISSRMAGIWNHLTVMTGYPWESLEDEYRTFKMVRWLLLNDWAASMQSTIFMPYPGTAAFKQCKEEGLLIDEDWNHWDMTKPVVKLKYDFKEALKLQRKYYNISYHPKFIWNKLSKIRTADDMKFYFRISKKVINRFSGIFDKHGVSID